MEIYIAAGILVFIGAVIGYAVRSVKVEDLRWKLLACHEDKSETQKKLKNFYERFVGAAKRAEGAEGMIKISIGKLVDEAEKILKEIKDGR